jgi:hypothetical protein
LIDLCVVWNQVFVIFEQNAVGRTLEVIILAVVNAPEKAPDSTSSKDNSDGNEEENNIHVQAQ